MGSWRVRSTVSGNAGSEQFVRRGERGLTAGPWVVANRLVEGWAGIVAARLRSMNVNVSG
jgi:hypothetical protein